MSRPHGLRLFMLIAPELRFREPKPILQQYWADRLGISQPALGKLLDDMVAEGVFVEHVKEGTARMFTVNPSYIGVQDHYNRTLLG